MSLYRLSGYVEAPDGTGYAPMFYGTRGQCLRVGESILLGATHRGERARVTVSESNGRVVLTRHVRQIEEVAV